MTIIPCLPQVIDRVRKLPNTLVRSDRDVRRLMDYQELELVLRGTQRGGSGAAAAQGPFSKPIVY